MAGVDHVCMKRVQSVLGIPLCQESDPPAREGWADSQHSAHWAEVITGRH